MFATGTNWSIVIDFLAPVKALARHETGTRPARTSDCLEAEVGVFLRDDQVSYKSGHGGNSAWLGILYTLRG